MEKSGMNKKRAAFWLPLVAMGLAALVALAGCPQTPNPDPVPGTPAKPVITLIKSGNTQEKKTGQGGEITLSWQAVEYATSYEVYYAPRTTTAPVIPVTAAQTVNAPATTATITAGSIGDSTMNYYVWVKAVNDSGTSDASPPASTLDRVLGVWMAGNSADGFRIGNSQVRYLMSWSGSDENDVTEYIRAVVPFENGSETVNFHDISGAAGVIVIEYDKSVDTNVYWTHLPDKYFIAIYYYGLTGNGAGSKAYLGHASDLEGTWGTPEYGCDVGSVDDAIGKFTFATRDAYVSPPPPDDGSTIYNWGSLE
jgi:hypothetical protein